LPASSLDRPNLVRTSDRVSAVQTPAQDNVVSTSHGAVPHDLGTFVPIAAKREADPLLVTAGTQGRGANGASDIITVRGDRWGEYSTTKGVTRVQENPRGNFERLRAYVSSSVPRPGSITEERIHGQAGVNLIYIADRSYETPEAFLSFFGRPHHFTPLAKAIREATAIERLPKPRITLTPDGSYIHIESNPAVAGQGEVAHG